ncbi:hypothetical protein [Paenirhodobacter sp.]|uniref:hypothetical protein n=1 Tax=Paenirhodobacter sp. TaxID=1965326 RepID=UPI003B3F2583
MRGIPDLAPFLHLRRHIGVAHHVPGRIRLKLAPAALAEVQGVAVGPFLDLLKHLPVHVARVNAAALSVVVEYDPRVVPASDWTTLLRGDAAQALAVLDRHLG